MVLYRFAKLFDESHGLPGKTSLEPSTSTSTEELDELISGHVKKSIQINTSETELLERSLLWDSGGGCCCIDLNVCLRNGNADSNQIQSEIDVTLQTIFGNQNQFNGKPMFVFDSSLRMIILLTHHCCCC
jgi:hypothetical protein